MPQNYHRISIWVKCTICGCPINHFEFLPVSVHSSQSNSLPKLRDILQLARYFTGLIMLLAEIHMVLTQCSRALHGKRKFAFYRTLRFIIAFTRARSGFYPDPFESISQLHTLFHQDPF